MVITQAAKRYRVGVDLHTLEGLYQGSRTHCLELFSRLPVRLPEVDFFFFFDKHQVSSQLAQRFTQRNTCLVNMPHRAAALRLGVQLPWLTARHKIDMLHMQYICPPILTAKTIVTIHDVLFEDYPQYFKPTFRIRSRILFRRSAESAESVVTVSNYSKDALERQYRIPRDKITTIYNSVDLARFYPGKEGADQIRSLGLTPGEYLLCVGRLEPRKNHANLLRAVALLPRPRPTLVIVGQRDFSFKGIFDLCNQLGMQREVLFLEDVDDSLLPVLYRHAKLLAYPSMAEGFGMPIIEAMASGIPIITSNCTSLPEIAGTAALLVDPVSVPDLRDAIAVVLSNPGLAERLRIAGVQRAKHFCWDEAADILARLYRVCLDPNGAALPRQL